MEVSAGIATRVAAVHGSGSDTATTLATGATVIESANATAEDMTSVGAAGTAETVAVAV